MAKKEALNASKRLLVDILELAEDSENINKIIDTLDDLDDYLNYVKIMDELQELDGSPSFQKGKNFIYHLTNEYRKTRKDLNV